MRRRAPSFARRRFLWMFQRFLPLIPDLLQPGLERAAHIQKFKRFGKVRIAWNAQTSHFFLFQMGQAKLGCENGAQADPDFAREMKKGMKNFIEEFMRLSINFSQ